MKGINKWQLCVWTALLLVAGHCRGAQGSEEPVSLVTITDLGEMFEFRPPAGNSGTIHMELYKLGEEMLVEFALPHCGEPIQVWLAFPINKEKPENYYLRYRFGTKEGTAKWRLAGLAQMPKVSSRLEKSQAARLMSHGSVKDGLAAFLIYERNQFKLNEPIPLVFGVVNVGPGRFIWKVEVSPHGAVFAAVPYALYELRSPSGSVSADPAINSLEEFLSLVGDLDYRSAYALVASVARSQGDLTVENIRVTEEVFFEELQFDENRIEELKATVAAEKAKEKREEKVGLLSSGTTAALTIGTPSETELRKQEEKRRRTIKCRNFRIGRVKELKPGKVEIWLTTQTDNGMIDNDKAILVKERDRWLIGNPIHIIR